MKLQRKFEIKSPHHNEKKYRKKGKYDWQTAIMTKAPLPRFHHSGEEKIYTYCLLHWTIISGKARLIKGTTCKSTQRKSLLAFIFRNHDSLTVLHHTGYQQCSPLAMTFVLLVWFICTFYWFKNSSLLLMVSLLYFRPWDKIYPGDNKMTTWQLNFI